MENVGWLCVSVVVCERVSMWECESECVSG